MTWPTSCSIAEESVELERLVWVPFVSQIVVTAAFTWFHPFAGISSLDALKGCSIWNVTVVAFFYFFLYFDPPNMYTARKFL